MQKVKDINLEFLDNDELGELLFVLEQMDKDLEEMSGQEEDDENADE